MGPEAENHESRKRRDTEWNFAVLGIVDWGKNGRKMSCRIKSQQYNGLDILETLGLSIHKETTMAQEDNVRLAMDQAWRDHQHTRDQTWKTLQYEIMIAAGLVAVSWSSTLVFFSLAADILLFFIVLSGIQITLRHRNKVEILKFKHIMNCEEFLGLHKSDLICDVSHPKPITFWHAFCPLKGNTALFILRMHVAIFLFSIGLLVRNISELPEKWRLLGYELLGLLLLVLFVFSLFCLRKNKKDDNKNKQ